MLMDLIETSTIKYPKSVKGYQCIGPCYKANTLIIHPTELTLVTNEDNFCPIDIRNKYSLTDKCLNITSDQSTSKEMEITMLNPYIDFSSKQFLATIYSIMSYDDALEWLNNNKSKCLETKIRVMRHTLNVFGSNIELVDNILTEFVIYIIKHKYIDTLYDSTYNYIDVKNGKIFFTNKNKSDKDENYKEKKSFIIEMFINNNEINKFLIRYFKQKKEAVFNYIDDIISSLTEYIITKIKKTILNV